MPAQIKVLFLASVPDNAPRLRVDEELHQIDVALRDRDCHISISLAQHHAVRPDDVPDLLYRENPDVVHFAGHGSGHTGELWFMNDARQAVPVPIPALVEAFRQHQQRADRKIRAVLLNSCWSEAVVQALQAEAAIDLIIGTTASLPDPTAIDFAAKFYAWTGKGFALPEAFERATNGLELKNMPRADVLKVRVRPGLDPARLFITDPGAPLPELPPTWGDDPEREDIPQPAPFSHEVLTTLLGMFPAEQGKIYIPDESRRISTGFSGASVYRVTIRRGNRDESAFAKFDVHAKVVRESTIHKAVKRSPIGVAVPGLLCEALGPVQGWGVALYQAAGQTIDAARTYDDILAKPATRDQRIAPLKYLLSDVLRLWHAEIRTLPRLDNGDLGATNEIPTLFRYLLNLGGKERMGYNLRQRASEHGFLADLRCLRFDDTDVVLPNPFAYLLDDGLWRNEDGDLRKIDAPVTAIHGDLHCKNIICVVDGQQRPLPTAPAVIDFGRSHSERIPFFDLVYLELDILLYRLPTDPNNRDDWHSWRHMAQFLASDVLPTDTALLTDDALELLWEYIKPLRAYANALIQAEPHTDTRRDFERAFWLSAVAAGMSVTRRSRMEPPEKHTVALLYTAWVLRKFLHTLGMTLPNDDVARVQWGRPRQDPISIAEQVTAYAANAREFIIQKFRKEFATLSQQNIRNRYGGQTEHPYAVRPTPDDDEDPAIRAFQQHLQRKGGTAPAEPDAPQGVRQALDTAKPTDMLDFLLESPRAILIGEPGAGKTVMLEYLMISHMERRQTAPDHPIPVLVPLAGFKGDKDFAAYAYEHLLNLRPHAGGLPLVWLLDGLNEMPETYAEQVVTFLQAELAHPAAARRFVLSCRIKDYETYARRFGVIPDLRLAELRPLLPQQIKDVITLRFAQKPTIGEALWKEMLNEQDEVALFRVSEAFVQRGEHRAFWEGKPDEAPGGTGMYYVHDDEMRKALEEKWAKNEGKRYISDYPAPYGSDIAVRKAVLTEGRRLMSMCSNPYTLNLLIQNVQKLGGVDQLPSGRAAIFGAFAKSMLTHELSERDKRKEKHPSHAEIWAALANVAEALQKTEQRTEIAEQAAIEAVGVGNDEAKKVLRVAEGAGLIHYRESIRFTHQLLQEYFAVTNILPRLERWEKDSTGDDATPFIDAESLAVLPAWRETLSLLVEVVEDPIRVVRWVLPISPEAAMTLAQEAGVALTAPDAPGMAEGQAGPGDPTAELRAALIQAALAKRETPDPRARAAAWRVIGALKADPRPGVLDFDIQWCEVPPGPFQMGGNGQYDGKPIHTVEVAAFQIAKYPVTYWQFQAFIDAPDGFNNPEWWHGLHENGLKQQRGGPGDQAFKFWNHPRERVSWYDAVAFCRWLSRKLGYEVRLPTEAEWEKAACWDGQRSLEYPYGDTFDAAKGNTNETGIKQTSAVGIFPDGAAPCRALDMSGNVWEWVSSKYEGGYPYRADDGREDLAGNATRRVRGGSWNLNQYNARAAYRSYYYPFNRNLNLGFRVVVGGRPPSV